MRDASFAARAAREPIAVRAERIRPALQSRVLGRAGMGEDNRWRLLHLSRGAGRLIEGQSAQLLTAPVLVWVPGGAERRITLDAGAQGTQILLGADTMERALRQRPEAGRLRLLATRPALLPLSDEEAAVSGLIDGILTESLRPEPMGGAVIESLLHVILVRLVRGQPDAAEPVGPEPLAARFAALVERHFRAHWTVEAYADALGISRDRLTDICKRAHGRPPGALLRARLHKEACVYLETAPLSLDEIAGLLGFSATPQFARFFKMQEGVPPGRYRAALRSGEPTPPQPVAPYAWP